MSATLHAEMSNVAVDVVGQGLLAEPHVAAKCPTAGRSVVVVILFGTVLVTVVAVARHRNIPLVEVHR